LTSWNLLLGTDGTLPDRLIRVEFAVGSVQFASQGRSQGHALATFLRGMQLESYQTG
jgi:hypothetical protein